MARLQRARATIDALAAQIHGTKTRVAALEAHGSLAGRRTRSSSALETRWPTTKLGTQRWFEEDLRSVGELRERLRSELRQIEEQRRVALEELSAPIKSLYVGLSLEGVAPATTTEADGACSACRATLPLAVADEGGRGEIRSCPQCRRLLCRLRSAA